jgi:hypothetical protein
MSGTFKNDQNFKNGNGGFGLDDEAITQQMSDYDGNGVGANHSILEDIVGRSIFLSMYGDIQTSERHSDVVTQFAYNISTDETDQSTANGGTITQSNSMAVLSTGTSINGEATLQSSEYIHYRPGKSAYSHFPVAFSTGISGSYQEIGCIDAEDGFAIGFIGESFGIIHRNNTVDIFITQQNFSHDKLDGTGPSRFLIDPTKRNIYSIQYGGPDVTPVIFLVYGGNTIGWIPFHIIDFANTQVTSIVSNAILPIRAKVSKTSGSADIQMKLSYWDGGVVGDTEVFGHNRYKTTEVSKTISAGVLTNLVTLRNQTTFQSKTNKVNVEGVLLTSSVDGTKSVKIYLIRNAVVGGTQNFIPVDAVNSVVEVDTGGTTVSGGITLVTFNMSKVDKLSERLGDLDIHFHPGYNLTIAAVSVAGSDVDVSFRWIEDF